jgi:hypothetical protein
VKDRGWNETGNHHYSVIFDHKKQRVRQATQEAPSDASKDDRELPRIIAHPFDLGVNRLAETPA